MKSFTEHLWFEVPERRGFVNITQTIQALVRKSGIAEGLVLGSRQTTTSKEAISGIDL